MKFFIKEARERAGYTQKQLAEIIGVAPNTFHGYESGKHDPKSDLLIQIAKTCDVSVDFLLGLSDESAPPYAIPETDVADEKHLLQNYRYLNAEGQEKLIEYSDDLVDTGKYKRHNEVKLGSKEA